MCSGNVSGRRQGAIAERKLDRKDAVGCGRAAVLALAARMFIKLSCERHSSVPLAAYGSERHAIKNETAP